MLELRIPPVLVLRGIVVQVKVGAFPVHVHPMDADNDFLAEREGRVERDSANEALLARRSRIVNVVREKDLLPFDSRAHVFRDGVNNGIQDGELAAVHDERLANLLRKRLAVSHEIHRRFRIRCMEKEAVRNRDLLEGCNAFECFADVIRRQRGVGSDAVEDANLRGHLVLVSQLADTVQHMVHIFRLSLEGKEDSLVLMAQEYAGQFFDAFILSRLLQESVEIRLGIKARILDSKDEVAASDEQGRARRLPDKEAEELLGLSRHAAKRGIEADTGLLVLHASDVNLLFQMAHMQNCHDVRQRVLGKSGTRGQHVHDAGENFFLRDGTDDKNLHGLCIFRK